MNKGEPRKPRRKSPTEKEKSAVDEKTLADAEFYLYTRLHRKYGDQYSDPFTDGPEIVAEYIDAFLEFIKQNYPDHGLGDIDNLASLLRARMPTLRKFQAAEALPTVSTTLPPWNEISAELFAVVSEIIRGMPREGRAQLLKEYSPKKKSHKDNDSK